MLWDESRQRPVELGELAYTFRLGREHCRRYGYGCWLDGAVHWQKVVIIALTVRLVINNVKLN